MSSLISRTIVCASVSFVLVHGVTSRAVAQCPMQSLPGDPLTGAADPINATVVWDRDGAGPLPPVVVVAGRFRACGSVAASGLACYEPVSRTWSTVGTGVFSSINNFSGTVNALAVAPNGDLLIGGAFASVDGVPANNIARWNGTTWSPLGSGLTPGSGSPVVSAITVRPNGDVLACGVFTTAGGVAAQGLARWDGSTWSSIATPNAFPIPFVSLATMANGDVVVGGNFTSIGGVAMDRIARWDGAAWSALGAGVSGTVRSLLPLANGDLIAGGTFVTAGGQAASAVARWNGTSWSPLGSGLPNPVSDLAAMPNGDIVACGGFPTAGGVPVYGIARFDGAAWLPLGPNGFNVMPELRTVTAMPDGDLVVGGSFVRVGALPAMNLARWDGASWSMTNSGTQMALAGSETGVHAIVQSAAGDLVVGGSLTTIGGVAARFVARRTGSTWAPLGTGPDGPVNAMIALPNGEIVTAGFATANPGGGVSGGRVSRWDGASWSPIGADFTTPITVLARLHNGDLVAGGAFPGRIARFDGVSWQTLGGGLPTTLANSPLYGSVVTPSGDLVVSGALTFGTTSYGSARWDGVAWSPMPSQSGPFSASVFAVLANGDLIGGGNSIVRWNGAQWVAYAPWNGVGFVRELLPLPDGSFVAADDHVLTYTNGIAQAGSTELRRWNGTAWSQFGASIDGGVHAALLLPDGDVVVGGPFTAVGGLVSAAFARLEPACRALAAEFGAGCTGSGGANVLAATALPWLGSTFRAEATGMPANGLALVVTGFGTASVPLAALLPQGGAGCVLLTTPDLVDVVLPVAGAAATQLAIPASSSLVGAVFHHQIVPFELDASANVVAVTSTNRLTALIGSF